MEDPWEQNFQEYDGILTEKLNQIFNPGLNPYTYVFVDSKKQSNTN